jgi:phage N-6-adenine-methyltransferase
MTDLTVYKSLPAKQKRYDALCEQGARVQEARVALSREIGADLMALRSTCKHGAWIPLLEKLGIPRSTAHDHIEAAKGAGVKADSTQLGYVGSKPGAPDVDKSAWFTPAPVLELARAVLGPIDFDPFSSLAANKTVKARRFCTEEDSAFDRETWGSKRHENIWMNPPYGSGLINKAVSRFCLEWDAGNFNEGIVLVNNATDTSWASELWERAAAVAFTRGRIGFVDLEGKNVGSNTRGQMFFYFGGNAAEFNKVFRDSCNVVPGRFA